MNSREVLSEKNQEKVFNQIQARVQFTHCADCPTKGPCWASLDFGILLCMNCSGAHRHLGPTISRVKSTKLDSWTPDMVDLIDYVGNAAANEYWEGNFNNPSKALTTNSSLQERIKFVTEQYVRKQYINKEKSNPMTEFLKNKANGKMIRANATQVNATPSLAPAAPSSDTQNVTWDSWPTTSHTKKQDISSDPFPGFLDSAKHQVDVPNTSAAPLDLLGGFDSHVTTAPTSSQPTDPFNFSTITATSKSQNDPFGFSFHPAPSPNIPPSNHFGASAIPHETAHPSFTTSNSPGDFLGFQSAAPAPVPPTISSFNLNSNSTNLNIMNLYTTPPTSTVTNNNFSHGSNNPGSDPNHNYSQNQHVNEDRYQYLNQMSQMNVYQNQNTMNHQGFNQYHPQSHSNTMGGGGLVNQMNQPVYNNSNTLYNNSTHNTYASQNYGHNPYVQPTQF